MSRCVVTVATGRYQQGGERLKEKMKEFGNCEFMGWTDPLPPDWPTHQDIPYGFKSYSLREAAKQYDLLLWCDAAVVPVKSLEPLWERIEREGIWIPLNGWENRTWTADSAYGDLFPGVPLEEAREMNRIPHAAATAFGINTKSDVGYKFLSEYFRLANTNAFKGPWSNTRNPNHWKQDPSRMGDCGPEDILGHRHDQSCMSLIAYRLGITLTPCPEFFAYPPAAENTILLAVGA